MLQPNPTRYSTLLLAVVYSLYHLQAKCIIHYIPSLPIISFERTVICSVPPTPPTSPLELLPYPSSGSRIWNNRWTLMFKMYKHQYQSPRHDRINSKYGHCHPSAEKWNYKNYSTTLDQITISRQILVFEVGLVWQFWLWQPSWISKCSCQLFEELSD